MTAEFCNSNAATKIQSFQQSTAWWMQQRGWQVQALGNKEISPFQCYKHFPFQCPELNDAVQGNSSFCHVRSANFNDRNSGKFKKLQALVKKYIYIYILVTGIIANDRYRHVMLISMLEQKSYVAGLLFDVSTSKHILQWHQTASKSSLQQWKHIGKKSKIKFSSHFKSLHYTYRGHKRKVGKPVQKMWRGNSSTAKS